MGNLHAWIDIISLLLTLIGALITIWGILISLFDFLHKEIFNRKQAVQLNDTIRIKLGSYLVLALEFFIASDIVKTIITPTWQSLGILGAIVVIRTILSYFLTKDIKDITKQKEAAA
ncbi:MAG: DUF1622 domain-containing protein [Candidatus Omnitrophota bacterium]|jgi:uncharacterized membrane protein